MSYQVALDKAWDELRKSQSGNEFAPLEAVGQNGRDNMPLTGFVVKFLGDEYSVHIGKRQVLSLACNVPAKEFLTILILHYLVAKAKALPVVVGRWLTFRELFAVEGYFAAFRGRVIERIIRKFGGKPEGLYSLLERLPGKKVNSGDVGIMLETFEGVPIMIEMWRADQEFKPEANVLFDASIAQIFCIEDVVVLAEIVASQI